MEKYKIFYDKWFFESELHKSGAVKAVVDLLTKKDLPMKRGCRLVQEQRGAHTEASQRGQVTEIH